MVWPSLGLVTCNFGSMVISWVICDFKSWKSSIVVVWLSMSKQVKSLCKQVHLYVVLKVTYYCWYPYMLNVVCDYVYITTLSCYCIRCRTQNKMDSINTFSSLCWHTTTSYHVERVVLEHGYHLLVFLETQVYHILYLVAYIALRSYCTYDYLSCVIFFACGL